MYINSDVYSVRKLPRRSAKSPQRRTKKHYEKVNIGEYKVRGVCI